MVFPSKLFGPNGTLTGLFASSVMKKGLAVLLKPVALFAHLFTNKTTTIDGTRYLVNQGEGENAVMHTGQGVYFAGDNHLKTGIKPNTNGDITVLMTASVSNIANATAWGVLKTRNFLLGLRETEAVFAAGGLTARHTHGLSVGDTVETACVYDKTNNEIRLYINGQLVASEQGSLVGQLYIQDIYIGAFNANGSLTNFANGVHGNFYYLTEALTGEQVLAHYNKPENTLYWDSGLLSSEVFNVSNAVMWLPFSDKEGTLEYKRNHIFPITSENLVDITTPTYPSSDWAHVGDAVYDINTSTFSSISWLLPDDFLAPYAVEFEITQYVSGELRGYNQGGLQGSVVSGIGHKSLTLITGDTVTRLGITARGSFVGQIKMLRIYPLADNEMLPLINWTSSTTTNASQLTTGFQTVLVEQDNLGLPIALKTYNIQVAEGGTLIDLNNAANPQGLNFVDNAGTLEVYKQ